MSNGFSSNANPSGGTKQKVEGKLINLTQHAASAEQLAAGVVEPTDKARVQELLTFEGLPSGDEILARAKALAAVAADGGADAAMIGGAPYLMASLEWALKQRGITPLYAFSVRESTEQVLPDGTVRKVAVFKHLGFVTPTKVPSQSLKGWDEIEASRPVPAGWDKIEASKPVPTGWDEIVA